MIYVGLQIFPRLLNIAAPPKNLYIKQFFRRRFLIVTDIHVYTTVPQRTRMH